MYFRIEKNGEAVGTLTLLQNGLFWEVTAQCHVQKKPLRLFACNPDGQTVRLGIPEPENGLCKLEKKLPLESFPFCEETRIHLAEHMIGGIGVSDGEITEKDGNRFLVIPYEEREAFCLMPWVCFFTIEEKDGKMFWLCRLDEKNTPIFG